MVALEGRWEGKKKRNCFQDGTWYQRGWLKFYFYDFLFSFLVFGFGLWFFTVALLAWRVVFFLLVGAVLGLYTT